MPVASEEPSACKANRMAWPVDKPDVARFVPTVEVRDLEHQNAQIIRYSRSSHERLARTEFV